MTRRVPPACVLLLLVLSVPALGQDSDPSALAADLERRAAATILAIDAYFGDPRVGQAASDEALVFRTFTRELRGAMESILPVARTVASGGSHAGLFGARLSGRRLVAADLVDAAASTRIDRLLPLDDVIRCCDTLNASTAPAERALAGMLSQIWSGFARDQLGPTIVRLRDAYARFEEKLLEGFPAMPWEYVLNFQGGREGPSVHQLIWAHPSIGFEVDPRASQGSTHIRSVLVVQAAGYNFYFLGAGPLRGLKYLGTAAILTLNTTAGQDRWRRGGLVHLGNRVSLGATYGDTRWIWFASSDRLTDAIVRVFAR